MSLTLDIFILAGVLAWAAWALLRLRRQRRCGGGCAGCPYAGSCKSQQGDDSHD
ncbi:MAG: FeoB-associated Cys-rich membrane protein [Clostridiales bacterium]|nr:FeoB-associated Cys-rich membrane protein [Clostridiales bacterium]